MERDQAAATARQAALKDILSRLKALKTAANDLQSVATWAPTQKIASADATRVGARQGGTVDIVPGTYDVSVTQLARGQQETWSWRQFGNTRPLQITDGAGTAFSVTIPANATVDTAIDVINQTSGLPVTAVNFNGEILFRSKTTGATAGAFTVSGQNLQARTSFTAAQNTTFTVNGVGYTSPTSVATDAIPGLELTLSALTPTGPVAVTVGDKQVDKAVVAAKLKAFVDAYNATQDLMRSKLTEKRVPTASNNVDAAKGALFADTGLSRVASDLRIAIMDPLTGVGNATSMDELREIGLGPAGAASSVVGDNVNGKLVFDEAAFTKAWDTSPASVDKLLKGVGGAGGFAQRLDALLTPLAQGGGLFDGRVSAADGEVNRIKDSLKRLDERLIRKEAQLRKTFTALETAMLRAQQQQTDLSSRLPRMD
jgi:flagellar hook-associated protein 2